MSFDLTLGGRTQRATSRVEEPGDGVIEEHIVGRDMVTTFTVRPDGDRTTARIETRVATRQWPGGCSRTPCCATDASARSTGTSLLASIRSPPLSS